MSSRIRIIFPIVDAFPLNNAISFKLFEQHVSTGQCIADDVEPLDQPRVVFELFFPFLVCQVLNLDWHTLAVSGSSPGVGFVRKSFTTTIAGEF